MNKEAITRNSRLPKSLNIYEIVMGEFDQQRRLKITKEISVERACNNIKNLPAREKSTLAASIQAKVVETVFQVDYDNQRNETLKIKKETLLALKLIKGIKKEVFFTKIFEKKSFTDILTELQEKNPQFQKLTLENVKDLHNEAVLLLAVRLGVLPTQTFQKPRPNRR